MIQLATKLERKSVTFAQSMQRLKFRLHEQSIRRSVTEIFICYFYSILGGGPWRGSVRVVRGPVRR